MAEPRFIDALNEAIAREMEQDVAVMVLGEDVAVGGPFGVTAGLVEKFGEKRVVNTPISEDSIMGMAIGAALAGRRPIVEIMFIDFLTLATNQLVNHAAKLRYMSGGQLSVPMVIRVQQGAVGGWGAQHSQSMEAWYQHVPGLKMVAASNADDAASLITAAIRDDDPVLFLEHRGLYYRRDRVADTGSIADMNRARIVRPGRDVTIVTYSRRVWDAIEAAEELDRRGVSAEVIDLRSLVPLDMDTIVDSVKRTNRVLIAHEAVMNGGLGAEITARIMEVAFDWLDAPVLRVGAPFVPVPASPALEKAFVPDARKIAAAADQLVTGKGSHGIDTLTGAVARIQSAPDQAASQL